MDLSGLQNYFKGLASTHAGIGHDIDGAVRFGQIDMIRSEISSNISDRALVLEYPEYSKRDPGDNPFEEALVAFWIIEKPADESYDSIMDSLNKCKGIADDLLARIVYDYGKGVIDDFNINATRMNKIGPFDSDFYGWRVEVNLTTKRGSVMNPDVWTDL